MKIVRLSTVRVLLSAFVMVTSSAGTAMAGFVTPVTPSWDGGPNTTSQIWGTMVTGAVPQSGSMLSPTTSSSNPNGTAGWYDATAPGDGAFPAGSDAYSFSGVITPTATIPGYNLSGHTLNVFAEVESNGNLIATGDLTAMYTDLTGPHSILVSTLPSYRYVSAYDSGLVSSPFGPVTIMDHTWAFSLPTDVSNLKLRWGWDVLSSGISGLSVFTQSVPEPGSIVMAILGAGALFVAGPRLRRSPGVRSLQKSANSRPSESSPANMISSPSRV